MGKRIFFFRRPRPRLLCRPFSPLFTGFFRRTTSQGLGPTHAFHFHRSAGTEKDLVLGGTALGRRSDPARICRFCTKTFLLVFR